jgi:hypothetical protein
MVLLLILLALGFIASYNHCRYISIAKTLIAVALTSNHHDSSSKLLHDSQTRATNEKSTWQVKVEQSGMVK